MARSVRVCSPERERYRAQLERLPRAYCRLKFIRGLYFPCCCLETVEVRDEYTSPSRFAASGFFGTAVVTQRGLRYRTPLAVLSSHSLRRRLLFCCLLCSVFHVRRAGTLMLRFFACGAIFPRW